MLDELLFIMATKGKGSIF